MQYVAVLLIAAATFGVCYLFDKGFVALFRNKIQHRSGLAVRLNKRYASIGLILVLVGLMALFAAGGSDKALLAGGIIVLLLGLGLITYYMTFGVFYDDDSFILTTLGKKSVTYSFRDIRAQKRYLIQGGSLVIELHLSDGRAVSLQSGMEGTYPFLDHAFAAWCRQTGRDPKSCEFHDPSNNLWFPEEEDA